MKRLAVMPDEREFFDLGPVPVLCWVSIQLNIIESGISTMTYQEIADRVGLCRNSAINGTNILEGAGYLSVEHRQPRANSYLPIMEEEG